MFNLTKLKYNTLAKYKNNSNIEKSDLDWLFSTTIGVDRKDLYSVSTIGLLTYLKLRKNIYLRARGVPVSRIFNRVYFYDFDLKINRYVLSPRKETEILVDRCIQDYKESNNKKILDLCTGSGAIAIALKKHLKAKVFASDISNKALVVARKNSRLNSVNIYLIHSDLFKNIDQKFNIIVCNPPYIKSEEIENLDASVKEYDPRIALDGGKTGLDFYNSIINNAYKYLFKNGRIYLEIGYDQYKDIYKMLDKNYTNIECVKDYSGKSRVVVATKK